MTSRTHTPEDVQKIMEPWRDSASDYERGFIDGMQKQMQSSVDKAVNAIKEALAQPEHGWTLERIAGMARLKEAQDKKLARPEHCSDCGQKLGDANHIHTCSPQPEQDGKCKHCTDGCPACDARKLPEPKPMHPQLKKMLEDYFDKCFAESAPQRTWVGLTDEEIAKLHYEIKVQLMGAYKTEDIYRAIEAKLKEKNA